MVSSQATTHEIANFQEIVWEYFRSHRRDMPWRDEPTPYHVLVSELMLQQTQVARVVPKYQAFMQHFPTIRHLAAASLADVLAAWSGLGYNRRAKFLHAAAQRVVTEFNGVVPDTREALIDLPGIGGNTAGAVLAYAFNQPVVFIETNIRTVYFYHFFPGEIAVDDKDLIPLLEQTLDREHPREWYWALMDYGTHLKQTAGNNISQSKHYARQSKFEGSSRQIRGKILKLLVAGPQSQEQLAEAIGDERTSGIVAELVREGMLEQFDTRLRLTGGLKLP